MKKEGAKLRTRRQEVDVSLRRDSVLGFSWEVSMRNSCKETTCVGGFESLQQMFSDIDFLEMLQKNLGADSVPASVVARARARDVTERKTIPHEVVACLKEKYGSLVVDKRRSSKMTGRGNR